MYASNMKSLRSVLLILTATGILAGCHTASRQAAAPVPEADQVISKAMTENYMTVSVAAPHSLEQQKLILRMAHDATNGKELLLVMRAAVGVFPPAAPSGPSTLESQVRSTVTAKMMDFATLGQMIDYAVEYRVDAAQGRKYVERLFELGENNSDARVWYRIRSAASHLNVPDLEQQAQARGDRLASR